MSTLPCLGVERRPVGLATLPEIASAPKPRIPPPDLFVAVNVRVTTLPGEVSLIRVATI